MGQLDRLVRGFFDGLNAGDLDAVRAALDPSCEFVAPGFSGRGPGRRGGVDAAVGGGEMMLGRLGCHEEARRDL